MITALIIILSTCLYAWVGGWMFGYVRGVTNDSEKGWETPLPLMSGIFWPLALTIVVLRNIMTPAASLGYSFHKHQLAKKKKRIAQQEKIRIELKEAEKELEKIYQEMEQKEWADNEAPAKKMMRR